MKKSLQILVLILCIHTGMNAQISSSKLTLTANSLIYIVMPDTTSEISKKYMDVYKKYWTFSKYQIITADQKTDLAKPGNLFFGFSCYKRKEYNSNTFKEELTYMQVFIKLYEFEKEEKKSKSKEETYYESALVSFKLPMRNRNYFDKMIAGDFVFGNTYALDAASYDLDDNLFLWGPGLLKNYVQKLGLFMKSKNTAGEEDSKSSAVDNAKDIAKLKTGTLYIPDYCFYEYNQKSSAFKEDAEKKEKIMEKYTYAYEVLSSEELNEKILSSEEEFFYLVYTTDAPRKYINIISSKTGKIIYSDFATPSYDFHKNDMKNIMKAIDGE